MIEDIVLRIKNRQKDGVISYQDVLDICNRFSVHAREVEIIALQCGIVPERYIRNLSSISLEDQITLLNSSVCVIGLGGLGCYVCEELARLGVGRLTLCDHDSYDAGNLNRQLYCDHETLCMGKAEVAMRRIKIVNPAVEVTAFSEKFSLKKGEEIIKDANVVIDCTDNQETRAYLLKACKDMGVILIHGSIAGWYGQVSVIYPEDDYVREIIGRSFKKGIENQVGNLAFTAGVIASIQVAETIKVVLKKETQLRNRILFVDLLNLEFILSL